MTGPPGGSAAALEEKLGLARLKSKLFGDERRAILLGRYAIGRRLGAGGAGVVYAARDPELDRQVAIKLVIDRPGRTTDPAERQRLVREARALAKVSHPNILPIYDVGVWAPEEGEPGAPSPFIVMELVEGPTLGEWIKERSRSWEEIVDMFERCGRGLVAAHDAGLVHRDFKPGNVLVGHDARPRVSDFGLARRATEPGTAGLEVPGPPGRAIAPIPVPADAVTDPDSVSGTPAYMAPEQLAAGGAVDARSDQYAFCVALFEALCGELPFVAKNTRALAVAKEEGAPSWPDTARGVPSRLQAIVRRGLSPRPEQRFDSMAVLVAALARVRRRRGRVIAATAALAVGVFAAGWVLAGGEDPPACVDADALVQEAWSVSIQAATQRTFVATGLVHAEASFETVRGGVDAFVARWKDARGKACEALADPDDPARPKARRRVACLDGQLQDVAQLVSLLSQGDAKLVERASRVVAAFPDPAVCSTAGPDLPGIEAPEDEASLQARRDLSLANALRVTGRCGDAAQAAAEAAARLDATTHGRFVGRAHMIQGFAARCLGNPDEALEHLHRAALLFEQTSNAPEAARAWLYLSTMQAAGRGDLAAADQALEMGRTKMVASGARAPLEPLYLRSLAIVRFEQGRFDEAAAAGEKSVAVDEARPNPNRLWRAETLHELGLAYHRLARWDEAERVFEDARKIYEDSVGPQHPVYAAPLANLALAQERRGDYDGALAKLDAARRILDTAVGRELKTAEISMMRGYTLLEARRYEQAVAEYEALRPDLVAGRGADHPQVARADTNLAEALTRSGKPEAGLEAADRAVDVLRRAAPDHRDLIYARLSRSGALTKLDRLEEARRELDGLEPGDGPPRLAISIHGARGHVEEAAGVWEEAAAHYEKARSVALRGEDDPELIAETEFDLARVTAPADREAAIDLAQSALARLRATAPLRPEIEAWLSETYEHGTKR